MNSTTRSWPCMQALLEVLHCAAVAAGDPELEVGEAEAEGADVETAGLVRPASWVEVHVAHWPLPGQMIQTSTIT